MTVLILIVLMALFCRPRALCVVRFDIDIADVVASSVTPAIGFGLIYYYHTPLAWAGGLVLLAIGAFSLAYMVRRRHRPLSSHRKQQRKN
ncbi:MAG: hypothetical protein A49_25050 [Methyloceanibacter sp.]|nr:MAG: hypothetical protein A49_25050 [Methyloceanibacter sp.]